MGASSVAYTWDDAGRLKSQSDRFAGGGGNVDWTLTYYPSSQVATDTRSNSDYAFEMSQLTGTQATIADDYAVNGLNQYTAIGAAGFSYDANGNLESDGSWTYTWDIENRLVKAVRGGTTVDLVYDPLGRLFQTGEGPSRTITNFVYDPGSGSGAGGDALVLEYNRGDVANRYVHGANAAADDPLVWYSGRALDSPQWLHADRLGSIVAITDRNGAKSVIQTYDEYGINGTRAKNERFGYTGQAFIPELGLYDYKARFYSPTLGRFLQTDPIGYEGGINVYAYVGNDPVNATDPTGNDALWVTNPDGSITLIIPVQFSGSGATAANVAAIAASDNSLKIADPNLHIQVVSTNTPINGVLNKMDYSPGYNTKMCGSAGECMNRLGGNIAHINSANAQGNDAAAHDVLHFAGIKDQYVEEPRDAQGNRTSSPTPGYNDNNIMTSRSGNELKPQQFQEAKTNQTTKQCSVETGSRIPVCH